MRAASLDIAHVLAGGMLAVSFALLYQSRIPALLNLFAVQAILLALAITWQSLIQDRPPLLVTAALALAVNAVLVPAVLHRIVRKLTLDREMKRAIGAGPTMLIGLGLVALSMVLVSPSGGNAGALGREDLTFALAIVLLGLLLMIARRNALAQIVGCMSIESGLVLAAAGANGMPMLVGVTVVLSGLIALIVFGVFVLRIRKRFDAGALGSVREGQGEHP